MNITYIDIIKGIEDATTEKTIGKIKTELLNIKTVENLYYVFPLIERMVLEIYRLVPGANIEQFDKKTMKTINSILEHNKNLEIIPTEIAKIIQKYFKDDGIRNKLFHVSLERQFKFKINIKEINYIIMQLLFILKKLNKNYEIENLKIIEKL